MHSWEPSNLQALEQSCRSLWVDLKTHSFNPDASGEVFSVDTPPPYVSAAHLHVGHAMSYSQAEFIVRYMRMRGRNVFYPMGFDDNGLPTERYVEQKYKLDKHSMSRTEFRKLCLKETADGAKTYEELWRALGLSVDWEKRYSTIDDNCRRMSQLSFVDLFRKGYIYRANQPVLWDVVLETSISQSDLESIERDSMLNDIAFRSETTSDEYIISTSRPELLSSCVALYANAGDERYRDIIGKKVIVPLFDYAVPILADPDVDPAFGTGLMMVCTFGDMEDVKRWKRDGLPLRMSISGKGRMLPIAGKYAGATANEARKRIIEDLREAGLLKKQTPIKQRVSIAERSGAPVEFQIAPQWFIRIMDLREKLKARSNELRWFPPEMKILLDQWIDGLKFDWNISRQRYYGVPIPVWFTPEGEVILPEESELPVDPADKMPPSIAARHGSEKFTADIDVFDTWMTSSITPQINARWLSPGHNFERAGVYPMSIRVQAFEIIRTWLFYTVVKSELHHDQLPWRDVMISGWGLNEQGKKISKRDLEKYNDAAGGYNRYEPKRVIERYGADALRWWAASSQLGSDLRFSETEVQIGRRVCTKLWNASRLVRKYTHDRRHPLEPIDASKCRPIDLWILRELDATIASATESFDIYNYGNAKLTIDRYFWSKLCDNYFEMIKMDLSAGSDADETKANRRAVLSHVFYQTVKMYAPFVPYITEAIYQDMFAETPDKTSIHTQTWPTTGDRPEYDREVIDATLDIITKIRALRTARKIPFARAVTDLVIVKNAAPEAYAKAATTCDMEIRSATNAAAIRVSETQPEPDYEQPSEGVWLKLA